MSSRLCGEPIPFSMESPLSLSHTTAEVVPSPATPATEPQHHEQSHRPVSQWPSTEQQQGIAALSNLNDLEISSTIESLRLIPAHLTDQQLKALVCLRSAPDAYIKTWLDHHRRWSGTMTSIGMKEAG